MYVVQLETDPAQMEYPEQIGQILHNPPHERIVGRTIMEWSGSCGTYGQGGPGFFGLRLAPHGDFPEEWLILRLCLARDWLEVDGRWLGADPDQYDTQRPLTSNYSGLVWDELTPRIQGKRIAHFSNEKHTLSLRIEEVEIALHEDASRRPFFRNGKSRILCDTDDLRDAWSISPVPYVEI